MRKAKEKETANVKSTEGLPRGTPSTMCEWNDHGQTCGWRGILSPSTAGGPWYCREHFYKLRGYPDMEAQGLHGNELPAPLHSFAVEEMRKEMAAAQKREPREEG